MKTLINIKADQDVKISAQKLAKKLGLSLSAVVNAYLKQFVRSQGVNFSIAPQMSPKLEKLLDQVEYDLAHGKNIVGPFNSADEMIKSLKSLDKAK